jgi:oxygen-independent coproporphyrinogen-3 oxidase
MAPEHFSTYGLTYERGTTFFGSLQRGQLRETDEEQQREMYLEAIKRLGAAGWDQYEVSNFARPGCRSRHNENYWLGGRYSGIGAGASRFIGNERATNHRSTTTYIKRTLGGDDPTAERETLTAELLTRERVIFGLRRREGIDLATISSETGINAHSLVGDTLASFVELGLIQSSAARYWLTQQGLLVSDAIWPELL